MAGAQIVANGFDDPQAMRMILLQILTGRRSSEIRTCEFNCLSPATGRAVEAAQGEHIARFRYAQTKIDIAPDTILVDSEVVAIVEEQQQWIRDQFPAIQPRHLFLQLTGNRAGAKPYPSGTYNFRLREFGKIIQVRTARAGQSVLATPTSSATPGSRALLSSACPSTSCSVMRGTPLRR